jgi:hypothetical protein
VGATGQERDDETVGGATGQVSSRLISVARWETRSTRRARTRSSSASSGHSSAGSVEGLGARGPRSLHLRLSQTPGRRPRAGTRARAHRRQPTVPAGTRLRGARSTAVRSEGPSSSAIRSASSTSSFLPPPRRSPCPANEQRARSRTERCRHRVDVCYPILLPQSARRTALGRARKANRPLLRAIQKGCRSSGGTLCGLGDDTEGVAWRVDAVVFLGEVKVPVGVEVAVADQGA